MKYFRRGDRVRDGEGNTYIIASGAYHSSEPSGKDELRIMAHDEKTGEECEFPLENDLYKPSFFSRLFKR